MFKITKWTHCVTNSGMDEAIASKPENLNCHFRLLDDDGNVYAYGYADSDNDEKAFEPLDCFSSAYGVTEIQYYNEEVGRWETL